MTFSEYIERESGKEGRADGGRKAGSELRERERGEGEGEGEIWNSAEETGIF